MDDDKREIVYFQCEKKLKSDFYKSAQERNLSPGTLLRAFMRKALNTWETDKHKNNKDDSFSG